MSPPTEPRAEASSHTSSAGQLTLDCLDLSTLHSLSLSRSGGHVFKARLRLSLGLSGDHTHGGELGWVCVKRLEQNEGRQRAPSRGGRREAELLKSLSHDNVLPLLSAFLVPTSPHVPSMTYNLLAPYYPLPLSTLLDSPLLVPTTPGFSLLVNSLGRQLTDAVAYLHGLDPPVAHRDIGRNNVVISREGRAVLVDFGIATREGEEESGQQPFDFGTLPYKPPELIFSSRTYHSPSLDLWALGCLLAEFFTPLSVHKSSSSSASSLNSEEWRWKKALSDRPPGNEAEKESRLERETLFDGSQTDFALTGSIFRFLGTPTVESWPESAQCPAFAHFRFAAFEHQRFETRLLNLPGDPTDPSKDFISQAPSTPLLDIVSSLVRISAAARVTAKECLKQKRWRGVELLRPVDLGGGRDSDGKTLGQLLATFVAVEQP